MTDIIFNAILTILFATSFTYFYAKNTEFEGQLFYSYFKWLSTLKHSIRKTFGYCFVCFAIMPTLIATAVVKHYGYFYDYKHTIIHIILCYLVTFYLLRKMLGYSA